MNAAFWLVEYRLYYLPMMLRERTWIHILEPAAWHGVQTQDLSVYALTPGGYTGLDGLTVQTQVVSHFVCRLQSLQGRLKTVKDRCQRLKFLEDTVVSGGCEQSDANVGVTARTPRLSTEQGTA